MPKTCLILVFRPKVSFRKGKGCSSIGKTMTRGLCFRPAVPVPIIAGYLLGKYPPLSPTVRQVLLFSHMLHKLNNKWTKEKQLLLYLLQYMYTDRSHFVFLQLLGGE